MEILCVEWRAARDCIGIVLYRTEAGKVKCCIGLGMGINVDYDIQRIRESGAKLQMPQTLAFFPDWEKEIKENWFELDKWK